MTVSDQEIAVPVAVGVTEKLRRWNAFEEKRLAFAQVLSLPVVKEAFEIAAACIADEKLTVPHGANGNTIQVLMANQHARSAGWNQALTFIQRLARARQPDKNLGHLQEPEPWDYLKQTTETTEQDA